MRRLCRILWTTFAAASLLLCVAAMWEWAHSYTQGGRADWPDAETEFRTGPPARWANLRFRGMTLVSGWVVFDRVEGYSPADAIRGHPGWRYYTSARPEPAATFLARLTGRWDVRGPGFAYSGGRPGELISQAIALHLAYVVALFAPPPLVWFIGFRRRRRRAEFVNAGLCGQCGYDLRASPGRCPECGASSQSKKDHHGGHGGHRAEA